MDYPSDADTALLYEYKVNDFRRINIRNSQKTIELKEELMEEKDNELKEELNEESSNSRFVIFFITDCVQMHCNMIKWYMD